MSDDLRDRLADYLTRVRASNVWIHDGVVKLNAESMADALLPFVRAEIARELRWQANSALSLPLGASSGLPRVIAADLIRRAQGLEAEGSMR